MVERTEPTKLRPGERLQRVLTSRAAMVVMLLLILALLVVTAQIKNIPNNLLLALLVRGIMLGGTLALGAVGVTLVFGVLKMANFAHGDLPWASRWCSAC